MSKQNPPEQPTAPSPTLLPVISRAKRIEFVAYRKPGSATATRPHGETERRMFPPGLTFLPLDIAKACGFEGADDPFDGRGSLVVRDPLGLETHDAVAIARVTGDRSALRKWLEHPGEKRDRVRAAIRARLDGAPTNPPDGEDADESAAA